MGDPPAYFVERVLAAELEAKMRYPHHMRGANDDRMRLILLFMQKAPAAVMGIFFLHEDRTVTCTICGASFPLDAGVYVPHRYLHLDQVRTVLKTYGRPSGIGHAYLWSHTNDWDGVIITTRRTA